MLTKIISPFLFAARTFNTAANLYLGCQVGWWVFKQVREMQKERLQATELRSRFVAEFAKEYGREPDEETIKVALRSYNAVEKPLEHRIRKFVGCNE